MSRIPEYIQGKGKGTFGKWMTSKHGDYLHFRLAMANEIRRANVLIFDVEFYPTSKAIPRVRLVVWRETNPPPGEEGYQIVMNGDKEGRQRFLDALYRANFIIGYNSRELDLPALESWGLDDRRVLLKLIDLYEFIFSALSRKGTGSLDNVSRINGGLGKYKREDSSTNEYIKQCQRDVKILEDLFWKVLSGEFVTPRYSVLRAWKIWEDVLRDVEVVGGASI